MGLGYLDNNKLTENPLLHSSIQYPCLYVLIKRLVPLFLTAAPAKLLALPHLGERLDEFAPREVRRIFIEHYEMRYEFQQSTIYVLRLWHRREPVLISIRCMHLFQMIGYNNYINQQLAALFNATALLRCNMTIRYVDNIAEK
ncbi:MAG: ParE toxin of type II toxin-antitoxin system, parDE [Candidatus Nitrotoga sp. LAW]|nr:MAG: ParE toxin of type II toxin-antitoxin system, parDE [Candidatus Nitrotoga sp. LAW]